MNEPLAPSAGDGELAITGSVAAFTIGDAARLVKLLVEEGLVDLGRAACRFNSGLLAAVWGKDFPGPWCTGVPLTWTKYNF